MTKKMRETEAETGQACLLTVYYIPTNHELLQNALMSLLKLRVKVSIDTHLFVRLEHVLVPTDTATLPWPRLRAFNSGTTIKPSKGVITPGKRPAGPS